MAAPLSLFFATALWLCPLWLGPTPVVPSLLWGGICLGAWLLLAVRPLAVRPALAPRKIALAADPLLACLLASLGLMVLWRSSSLANALAANLCLLGIGLAACLGRALAAQGLSVHIAGAWLLAGLLSSGLALAQYVGWTAEPLGTAFGFLRQRNNMASLCMLATAALFYVCHHYNRSLRWAVPSGVLLMTALAATASRTGFLQLTLSATILLSVVYWQGRQTPSDALGRLAKLCLVCLISYAAAAWILPALIDSAESVMLRVLGSASTSADGFQLQDSRQQLWSNTWAVAQQHPLWGVGWRELAYALHMTDFGASERFGYQADNAHNLPLQLAAELGLPFAALWLLAVVGYAAYQGRMGYRLHRMRIAGAASLEASSLLGWAALLILALHSLLEYPLWYAPFLIALGLALGLITHSGVGRKPWIPAFVTRWLGAALILFCSFAAYDYHRVSQLFLSVDQRISFYKNLQISDTSSSWLFANQVQFAKFLTTTVTEENAQAVWRLGQQVIHFSPEARVLKALIAAGEHLEAQDAAIASQLVVLRRQLALIER